ncbi:prosaposin isoform X2 [Colletes latitarsis]|uniref:prosaposin isoform X2 n=1 Tax=Colletes latitarsis TaxID=2605962 RepID=UPI0040362B71
MKILIALSAILAVCNARVVINAVDRTDAHLLGQEKCTWGPSYWCENIKTASGCNATKHCIKTTWTDMKVPEDNDNVCGICKDMVQQARDQLESNQTQNDLKDVFEGSCKLMRIKPIVNECIKIVDQYIPDLVETLASQMNPSVVCSVAGLCNSAHIDKLLKESAIKVNKIKTLDDDELEPDECTKCHTVAAHMEYKLNHTPRDKMLQQMLNLCAQFDTFTDACSATILTYFNTLYDHLQKNFNTQNICHLSGQCSANFHKHEDTDKTPKVEIRPLSSVGMVDVSDDLPCKLCEQLVGHLRDLLVANTTEVEFRLVLDGLCKQTKSFRSECTSIVDEYYPEIYSYLTKNLNTYAVCQMSGICPAPGKIIQNEPIWPLIPNNVAEIGVRIFQDSEKKLKSEKHEELTKAEVEAMQLPIERMLPFPMSMGQQDVKGKESCVICEYVLHSMQEFITNPVNEEKLKQRLEYVCKKLPESVRGECSEFVDNYGDVIVAILAQEIDPSQVCPMLRLCPTNQLMQIWDSIPAKYMLEETKHKPGCPLCLLAITQIYNVIKNNKTERNIESALDKLCITLPRSLSEECQDLVKGYSKEIVELFLADLTPQEICVYIKMCDGTKDVGPKNTFITDENGEILTNEIPDSSASSDIWLQRASINCDICKQALRYIEKEIGSEKEKHKIENTVQNVCKHLSKKLSQSCSSFVNKHGDAIITAIIKNVSPNQVCGILGICTSFMENKFQVTEEKPISSASSETGLEDAGSVTTLACKAAMEIIENELGSDKGKEKVEDVVQHACNKIPKLLRRPCNKFVNNHGDQVIDVIVKDVSPKDVCSVIGLASLPVAEEFEGTDGKPLSSASSETRLEDTGPATFIVCEAAMHVIDHELGSDRGKQKVENVVHRVCNKLSKKFSGSCNNFVNNHGDQIIDVITKGVSPKRVCRIIGLASLPVAEEFEVTEEKPISNANSETGLEDAGSVTTLACKAAMEIIENELGSDKGKEKVEDVVQHACNKIPKLLRRPCNKFVNNHGDQVIDVIVKDVSPKEVCSVIGLASLPVTEEFEVTDENPISSASSETELEDAKSVTTLACKAAMEIVEKEVGSDKGKQKVENIVHHVCNKLPKFLSRPCNKFVNNHGDQVIDVIVKDVSPKEVCSVIGLASLPVTEEFEASDGKPVSSASSETRLEDAGPTTFIVCDAAMHIIDKELGSDKGKQKVENVVHHVCNKLPKALSRPCNKFVTNHGDQVIDFITKDISPTKVCSLMGLVPASMAEQLKASVVECALCKGVISVIDELLGNSNIDNNITNVVSKACKYLPASKQSKCVGMVKVYGPSIINLVERKTKSNEICSKIGICAPADYSTVSLEGSRIKRSYEKSRIKHCTWGPAYWCSTNETAFECKAVEHCKEHVWKADFAPPKQATLSAAEPNA